LFMPVVYLSIGSNLGNRSENCRNGIDQVGRLVSTTLKKQSSLYETEPVGYTNQGWFLNAAVKIETMLNPSDLLQQLKVIELDSGRDYNQVRFGPRTLDLDILLYEDLVINSASLVIPHPRMHERRFVLKPLCEIDPSIVHPVLKKSVARLLCELGDSKQKVISYI
jgi:2-amino-4-hydroxy-6-hydroxymethyldihydropteridine diphosphokinase